MASTPLESTTIRDPLVGSKLGDYQVIGAIGEGGMGVVYEAVHTVINKRVAIKVIKSEFAGDQVLVRRVVTEAQAVNAVRHRGIVDIHAHGLTPDGRPYLVMELLQGETVHDLLNRQRRLSRDEAMQLVFEATGPLFAAHKAGIVHRDLKPSNLFLCQDDDGERFMKLLDFGLAKRATPGGSSSTMTSASLIVGTPDYMAPEQARAQPTDARTDIYALGVMAFELLSGQLPYTAQSSVDLVMKHLTAPIPKLSDLDPTTPAELSDLVEQMMAKDAANRPQTLEPVRALLKQLLGRATGDLVPRPTPVRSAPVTPAFLEATVVRPSGQGQRPNEPKPSTPRPKSSGRNVVVSDEALRPSPPDTPPVATGQTGQTLVGLESNAPDELGTADTKASLDRVASAAELKTDPMRPAPEVRRGSAVETLRGGTPAVEPAARSSKVPFVVGGALLLVIAIGLVVVFAGGKDPTTSTPGPDITVVTPKPVDPERSPNQPPAVVPLAPIAADAGTNEPDVAQAQPPADAHPELKPRDRERTIAKPVAAKKPPTRDELLGRIDKLRSAAQAAGNPSIELFLNKYEKEVKAAKSSDDAFAVSSKLDEVQKQLKLR